MEDYTYDVISSAIAAGARPDMVQVGNEIFDWFFYTRTFRSMHGSDGG
jgi:arabinogalactan endo-1,4-beta-galactosidase